MTKHEPMYSPARGQRCARFKSEKKEMDGKRDQAFPSGLEMNYFPVPVPDVPTPALQQLSTPPAMTTVIFTKPCKPAHPETGNAISEWHDVAAI